MHPHPSALTFGPIHPFILNQAFSSNLNYTHPAGSIANSVDPFFKSLRHPASLVYFPLLTNHWPRARLLRPDHQSTYSGSLSASALLLSLTRNQKSSCLVASCRSPVRATTDLTRTLIPSLIDYLCFLLAFCPSTHTFNLEAVLSIVYARDSTHLYTHPIPFVGFISQASASLSQSQSSQYTFFLLLISFFPTTKRTPDPLVHLNNAPSPARSWSSHLSFSPSL